MIKAVVFDIDGTLTIPPSGSGWLELTRYLGADTNKHLEILEELLAGDISLNEAKRRLLAMWRTQGPVTRERVREAFSSTLLREGAKEAIEYLKSKNYLTALITGSPDTYAEIIAKKLGVSEYLANDFVYDQNGNLADFHYDPAQDEKKLNQLKDFLTQYTLKPEECVVVGDGWNDNKTFSYTGKGIALKSLPQSHFWDERLENIAWKVIKTLSELKGML